VVCRVFFLALGKKALCREKKTFGKKKTLGKKLFASLPSVFLHSAKTIFKSYFKAVN